MLADGREADPRTAGRSNVFLSAVLLSKDQQRPVRVRNISTVGALVDGANLPPAGEEIQLIRGHLRVRGEVAWQREKQCGLRFSDALILDDWVSKVEHAGQRRVDHVVSLIRDLPAVPAQRPVLVHEKDSLESAQADLADVRDRLANSPDFVAQHGEELLKLDAISQRLGNLSQKR